MKRMDPTGWGWSSVSVVRLDAMRALLPRTPARSREHSETLLLIEVPQALPLIDRLPRRPSVVIARFNGLDKELLRRVSPDRVICPLISADFDALEVLRCLRRLRWQGPVEVVGGGVSDPDMVEEELRAALPGRRVNLLSTSS